jgi:Fe-S-cluster-containing hydrogenase component 2
MLAKIGLPAPEDIAAIIPSNSRLQQGPIAIFECFQRIPCNPCADACPRGAIYPFSDINECPSVDENRCNGCGVCLAHCPGLSIFVVDYTYGATEALVKIPYEFVPLPQTDEVVIALNRTGSPLGTAQVVRIQRNANKTTILWLTVPKELAMQVRHIARRKESYNE